MRQLFVLLLFCCSTWLSAQDWSIVGSPGFSTTTVFNMHTVIYQDTVYIAYTANDGISVVKYNGTGWEHLGAPGFFLLGGNPNLAFHNDSAYVSFNESINGKALLMRFNGMEWVQQGSLVPANGDLLEPKLAINTQGIPHIFFADNREGFRGVMVKLEGGVWTHLGESTGFTSDRAALLSFDFDEDTPYVGFRDVINGISRVMSYDPDNGWQDVGAPGLSLQTSTSPKLVIENGVPHISVLENPLGIKSTVLRFNGTNWVRLGAQGFSEFEVSTNDFAVDGNRSYFAFRDQGANFSGTVMKYDGTDWKDLGSPGFTPGEAGPMSLAADNGKVYLAFQDNANENKLTVMQFLDDATTSVSQIQKEKPTLLTVSPNPIDQSFALLDTPKNINHLEVLDMTGKTVLVFSPGQNRYDISQLPVGIYWLSIHTPDRKYIRRLVKQ